MVNARLCEKARQVYFSLTIYKLSPRHFDFFNSLGGVPHEKLGWGVRPASQNLYRCSLKKPFPIYDQNGQNELNLIPYFRLKQLKNRTLWDST